VRDGKCSIAVSTKSKSEIFLAAGLDKLGKSLSCVIASASYPSFLGRKWIRWEWIASSLEPATGRADGETRWLLAMTPAASSIVIVSGCDAVV
jgi:hypothetical protein